MVVVDNDIHAALLFTHSRRDGDDLFTDCHHLSIDTQSLINSLSVFKSHYPILAMNISTSLIHTKPASVGNHSRQVTNCLVAQDLKYRHLDARAAQHPVPHTDSH